jgi:hypothetical protein
MSSSSPRRRHYTGLESDEAVLATAMQRSYQLMASQERFDPDPGSPASSWRSRTPLDDPVSWHHDHLADGAGWRSRATDHFASAGGDPRETIGDHPRTSNRDSRNPPGESRTTMGDIPREFMGDHPRTSMRDPRATMGDHRPGMADHRTTADDLRRTPLGDYRNTTSAEPRPAMAERRPSLEQRQRGSAMDSRIQYNEGDWDMFREKRYPDLADTPTATPSWTDYSRSRPTDESVGRMVRSSSFRDLRSVDDVDVAQNKKGAVARSKRIIDTEVLF